MAKTVSVVISDDLDGSDGAEPVTFGIDGVAYQIDPGPKNRAKLDKAFAPYIERGRRVSFQAWQPFSTQDRASAKAAGRLAKTVPALVEPLESILDYVLSSSQVADHYQGQPHKLQPVVTEEVVDRHAAFAAIQICSIDPAGQPARLG
jgi:hypothetical protein